MLGVIGINIAYLHLLNIRIGSTFAPHLYELRSITLNEINDNYYFISDSFFLNRLSFRQMTVSANNLLVKHT
jgi:hypothetical protein